MFSSTKAPNVCVDQIQTATTRKICVDEIRTGRTRVEIDRATMDSEPAAGGSGRVAYPPPPGMLPHLPTLLRTVVTR